MRHARLLSFPFVTSCLRHCAMCMRTSAVLFVFAVGEIHVPGFMKYPTVCSSLALRIACLWYFFLLLIKDILIYAL